MNTSNNTILITGGATGIGLALAEQFVQLGNNVIICGRRENKLSDAKQKLPAVRTKVCNISNDDERIHFAESVIKEFPDLNILINNAGIQQEIDLSDPQNLMAVRAETETNFIAPVHLSALLIPHLRTKEHAAIINVSSGLGFAPLAIMPVYCATKVALHSYSLSLRHQLKNTSVKVFEIIPPIVDTELDRGARAKRGQTDRGKSADECAVHAIEAMKNDVFEAAIGAAANLRAKREDMFPFMNR